MKKQIHRESAGRYYLENWNADGDTLNIYKISSDLWGYSIGRSMTKGTARTLHELKKKLGII